MLTQPNEGFLNILGRKLPNVVKFAKIATVIGATFLTVFTAEANSGQQSGSEMEHGKALAVKQVKSPRRGFLNSFVRGMATGLALGSGNSMVDATLGGTSEFAVTSPNVSKTPNRSEVQTATKSVAIEKSNTVQPELKKVTTQPVNTPAVGMMRVRE